MIKPLHACSTERNGNGSVLAEYLHTPTGYGKNREKMANEDHA
jgi:hypothetical protein